jgi:hypothetical protein
VDLDKLQKHSPVEIVETQISNPDLDVISSFLEKRVMTGGGKESTTYTLKTSQVTMG